MKQDPLHTARIGFLLFAVVCALVSPMLLFSGCANIVSLRIQDSPNQHFENGMRFLVWGKQEEAEREFAAAARIEPTHPRAFAALGMIAARNHHFLRARLSLSQAATVAETPEDKALVQCAVILFHTEQKGNGWIQKALAAHQEAVRLDPENGDSHYFMGMAYKEAHDFEAAFQHFSQAELMPGYFTPLAATQARLTAAIRDVNPQTPEGKEVALVDRLTRADLASLLVHELALESLLERQGTVPDASRIRSIQDVQDPQDAHAAETVARLGIKGLEISEDGMFRPHDLVTRAQLATILQSVLLLATQQTSTPSEFGTGAQRYPDIPEGSPSYSAVTLLSNMGVMRAAVEGTGEFDPLGSVSGPDALLIVGRFKQRLHSLTRSF